MSHKHSSDTKRLRARWASISFALIALAGGQALRNTPPAGAAPPAPTISPAERFGRLPLHFIENGGQLNEPVSHYLRGRDKSIYFTPSGVTYKIKSNPDSRPAAHGHWAVELRFVGSNPDVQIRGQSPAGGTVSYFRGPEGGTATGLNTFRELRYVDLWPGIDLVYSTANDALKYAFLVEPGADPNQIRLAYRGADVTLTTEGQLSVSTPRGGFHDDAPCAYQELGQARADVRVSYDLERPSHSGAVSYGFRLGPYDRNNALIIDPAVIVYAGYLGGAGEDVGNDIAVDAAGNVYIVGNTSSSEQTFPTQAGPTSDFQGGGACILGLPCGDAFVAKLNPAGELVYAGYIGGAGADTGTAIAVDAEGAAYITGMTTSSEATFPVRVGPDLTHNSANGLFRPDAFVAKIDPSGTSLIYAGYIGGAESDQGADIAVDSSGNAYVTGNANSPQSSFPATVGPDLTHNSFTPNNRSTDAFIAKVQADGSGLIYAGYIGGESGDSGTGVAIDSRGNAYVTGWASSRENSFPTTIGPDLTFNGGPQGSGDAYVVKVNAAGTGFVYGGYIGGAESDSAGKIAVDGAGAAYVYGLTASSEATFPATVGPDLTFNGGGCEASPVAVPCSDAFVAKVRPDGSGLAYAGYIGGTNAESNTPTPFATGGVAVDAAGSAYITGVTFSNEASFPVVDGPDLTFSAATCGVFPFQSPCSEAFVVKVTPDGATFEYAGYLGGTGHDQGRAVAVDAAGNAYVVGSTTSDASSLSAGGGPDATPNGGTDVLLAKISFQAGPAIVSAASFAPGPIAPGGIVTIFGNDLGPDAPSAAQLDANGRIALVLSESEVLFDGVPGALFYVSSGQINVQAPYEIDGSLQVTVEVRHRGQLRLSMIVPVALAAPAVFTVEGGGGQAVALNPDGALNSAERPAAPGDIVVLYATGEGQTTPGGVTGALASQPYPRPVRPVAVWIGGSPCEILYAGAAPGYAGLMQINARIPSGAKPNGTPVELKLQVGELSSQPGVTLEIQ